MITGIHAVVFSAQPEMLREFFTKQLDLDHSMVFHGWPIFTTPTVELGCHKAGEHGAPGPGTHQISFYCDDLEETMRELKTKGVQFVGSVDDRLYGISVRMSLPDGTEAELYQPKYRGPWSKDGEGTAAL
jgi:hypothetical protein